MRALTAVFLLLLTMPTVHALVQLEGFVTDAADIFTPEEESALQSQLVTMFDSGRVQYAIVTVPDLEGQAIEEYSRSIVEGQLGDTDLDNGLLLLIAPTEHQYRFEVGRGLEGTLNDAKIGRVGRTYLVPAFQAERYGEGALAASIAVDELTQGVTPADMQGDEQTGFSLETKILLAWVALYIIISIIAAVARKKRKDKYANAAEVVAWMMLGGRGGGGSGGGGGGFGGGSFGGGGASGGW